MLCAVIIKIVHMRALKYKHCPWDFGRVAPYKYKSVHSKKIPIFICIHNYIYIILKLHRVYQKTMDSCMIA